MRSSVDANIDASETSVANADIVTQLPPEVAGFYIFPLLPRSEIFHPLLVSKSWHSFFNRAMANDLAWQKLITNHFDISLRNQQAFAAYVKPEHFSNETIYRSLMYVQRHLSLLPKHLKDLFGNSHYQWQWLAWGSGNESIFEKVIPRDESFTWLSMTLHMRPMFPFESLMLHRRTRALDLFTIALKAAHLPAVMYLLKNADLFSIQLEQDHLNKAAKTGNLALVTWIFSHARANNVELIIDDAVAEHAALSGNLILMRWIGVPKRELIFTQRLFECALSSGNIDLVNWLYQKMVGDVQITQSVLQHAAHSGNVELVSWLLTLNPLPDREILSWAALSGNQLLVDMLLKYFEDNEIDYIIDFLDAAITSKNKILVKNLLWSAPLNHLFFTVNIKTLCCALRTGDIEMINIVWNWTQVYSENVQIDRLLIDEIVLEEAASSGSTAALEWAFKHNFNLRRMNDDTLDAAIHSENISLVWAALEPRRALHLQFDLDFSLTIIMPYNLICCDNYVKNAILNIGEDEGVSWLNRAYDKSPRHCYRVILHLLSVRPLSRVHQDWLWNQLLFLAAQKTCLPVELESIQVVIDKARLISQHREEFCFKLNAFEEKLYEVNIATSTLASLLSFVPG